MNLDSELKTILEERLKSAAPKLREAMEYSVLGPGKRIRPRLLLSAGVSCGLEKTALLPVAAAIEFIHAYTLIHDDLPCMDNDDLRRGRPTTHKVYGEGAALLAGDSLIPLAFDLLGGADFKAEYKIESIRHLAEISGALGVVSGQSLEEVIQAKPGLVMLEKIFSLKTGALFRACLVLPALLSGKSKTTVDTFSRLGTAFGIAFQVADDLEDDEPTAKKNPAHILHYMDSADAIAWAESKIETSLKAAELLSEIQMKPLLPYFTELKQKLAGAYIRD